MSAPSSGLVLSLWSSRNIGNIWLLFWLLHAPADDANLNELIGAVIDSVSSSARFRHVFKEYPVELIYWS